MRNELAGSSQRSGLLCPRQVPAQVACGVLQTHQFRRMQPTRGHWSRILRLLKGLRILTAASGRRQINAVTTRYPSSLSFSVRHFPACGGFRCCHFPDCTVQRQSGFCRCLRGHAGYCCPHRSSAQTEWYFDEPRHRRTAVFAIRTSESSRSVHQH